MPMDDPQEDDAMLSSRFRYDVFLSFRGADTCHGIVDRLHRELVLSGVRAFRGADEEGLERGEETAPGLLEAIDDSAAAVAVISENYAASRRCLEELARAVERGKLLLPVFYDVSPSHVRRQGGPFEQGFREHEARYGAEKVRRWRTAMEKAGGISGWESKSWDEPELIQSLVKRILTKLKNTPLGVAKYPVGLDCRLEELKRIMDVNLNGVLILGFYGMGGVGKTTLAKALHNKLVVHFPRCSFVPKIREASQMEGGLESLQAKLISDLSSSKESGRQIEDISTGINLIKRLVYEEPVLILLDDVNDIRQLKALAGSRDWFFEGTRIIVTTRDKEVLPECIVNVFYEVKELIFPEALQLFSFHAFGRDQPNKNLKGMAEQIVSLTGGLPLALEVFGSFLYDKRRTEEWQDALQKVRWIRPGCLQDVLGISFNKLDDQEKCVFLDIACFFIQMKMTREDAIYILRGCDLNPEMTIKVLTAKSLVKIIEDDILWMHDQIRDMGREIVQRENYEFPGMRSRLWDRNEILTVLKNKKGTRNIQGITLDMGKRQEISITDGLRHNFIHSFFRSAFAYFREMCKNCFPLKQENEKALTLQTDCFKPMVDLRLLQINYVALDGDFKYIPAKLKWLQWKGCPLKTFPFDSCLEDLGVLDLSESKITSMWERGHPKKQLAKKLLVMDLCDCYYLTDIPDLSGFDILEKLILVRCKGLLKIPKSVGDLTKLIYLNLSDCSNLLEFPSDVSGLKCLETLVLSGCSKLKELPTDLSGMRSLKELYIDNTAIAQLPQSIFRLTKLEKFSLKRCRALEQLPDCIGELRSLKNIALDGSLIKELPSSIGSWTELEKLSLVWCTSLTTLPDTIGNLRSLTHLLLGSSSLIQLPASVGQLSQLKYLSVDLCKHLSQLPDTIGGLSSLIWLDLRGTAIEEVPSQVGALNMLEKLDMRWCGSLKTLPESIGNMSSLTDLFLDNTMITTLPKSMGMLESLHTLRLSQCTQLRQLPASLGKLKRLVYLVMPGTCVTELPQEFGMLTSLTSLKMRKERNRGQPLNVEDNPELAEPNQSNALKHIVLPESFANLCSLKEMDAHAWGFSGRISNNIERLSSLEDLNLGHNDFSSLPSSLRGLVLLKKLNLSHCNKLTSLPPLPSSLLELNMANCTALEHIYDLTNVEGLKELNFTNCSNLVDIPGLQVLKSLRCLFLGGCKACFPAVKRRIEKVALKHLYNLSVPGCEIPQWFSQEVSHFAAPKNRKIRAIIFVVVISLDSVNRGNIPLPAIVDIKGRLLRLEDPIHTTTLKLMGVPDKSEDQLYLIRFPEFKPMVRMLKEGDRIDIVLQEPPYFPGLSLKKRGIYLVFENDDDYDGNEECLDESQQSVSQKLAKFLSSL
ncbi:disease resistance protein RPV1-like isoform X1 [Syzygium oleosum]|uniref:disease resistance protein RPV1-like isoform X1 n=1 Tax=Syzygium oleosum TaxID=219896 RepID=UPI0024BBAC6A|nr:disease resistance protein RPV1-like isoform X1 [Syzygium oleosum]